MKITAVLVAALCLVAYATAAITECGDAPSGCSVPAGTYDCDVSVPGMTIQYSIGSIEADCDYRQITVENECFRRVELDVHSDGDIEYDYDTSTCNDPDCPFACDDFRTPITASGDTTDDGYCDFLEFNSPYEGNQYATRCTLRQIADSAAPSSPFDRFNPSGLDGTVPRAPVSPRTGLPASPLTRGSSGAALLVPTGMLAVIAVAALAFL
eukprot:TRINITY_DN6721_c0_g1_i1.p1 TRINITY_DN6721_c0_g1~~TRINITY_DN6721_c0_g1_i1.p1  ORF type:complete len:218 (+),score=51.08 TRINITY_DN6721_c0_g1_i1:23-655(+)